MASPENPTMYYIGQTVDRPIPTVRRGRLRHARYALKASLASSIDGPENIGPRSAPDRQGGFRCLEAMPGNASKVAPYCGV
jgi:hypothetical protein